MTWAKTFLYIILWKNIKSRFDIFSLGIFKISIQKECVLKIKQSVAEIVQCEKNMDIQKLRNLLFFLLEDLKNNDVPNFSTANMEEINFFSIFRLIMCNSEYLKDEDLSYNMIWILGILLDNENITFEFLKEQKLIEFLYFLLNKASIKIQSMVSQI